MVSAFSIGTSQRSNNQKTEAMKFPGPGQYNPSGSSKKNAPGWKIGTASRLNIKNEEIPGPGQYEQNKSFNKKKFPEYTFGTKSQNKIIQKVFVPGPGAYEPRELPQKNSPIYSFGLKTGGFDTSFHKTPGPGQYNPQNYYQLTQRPASKIGTAQRQNLKNDTDTPGPGTYLAQRPTSSGPQYRFGSSQRNNDLSSQNIPGPGAYQLQTTVNNSKGSTIVPKRPDNNMRENEKVPGPGAYTPKGFDFKIGAKIGTSIRDPFNQNDTPGPGQYTPKLTGRAQFPQYRIGTSQRQMLAHTLDTPGPGQYNIPEKITDGPKYTCVKRKDELNLSNFTPGPGSYQPKLVQTNIRAPSPIIGTSNRSFGNENQKYVPGPGQYNLLKGSDGPQWGFGRETRLNKSKANTNEPGPGSYNLPSMVADVPKYLLQPQIKKQN